MITDLDAINLKTIFKAYQLCYSTHFDSQYEKVEGDMTVIVE